MFSIYLLNNNFICSIEKNSTNTLLPIFHTLDLETRKQKSDPMVYSDSGLLTLQTKVTISVDQGDKSCGPRKSSDHSLGNIMVSHEDTKESFNDQYWQSVPDLKYVNEEKKKALLPVTGIWNHPFLHFAVSSKEYFSHQNMFFLSFFAKLISFL